MNSGKSESEYDFIYFSVWHLIDCIVGMELRKRSLQGDGGEPELEDGAVREEPPGQHAQSQQGEEQEPENILRVPQQLHARVRGLHQTGTSPPMRR